MFKLDNRLQSVLNEIDNVKLLADIGCDHGKLIVSAILSKKAEKGIAVDISYDSLNKARILAKKYKVDDKIKFFVGDGFLPVEEKIDVAVISGMGAREIVKIIFTKDISKKYILVPHQDTHILRKYLKENNFSISRDYIVKEQKYYPVIVAQKGNNDYSDKEIYLGKNVPESKAYAEWLNARYNIVKNIVEKAGENSIDNELREEWEVLKKWQN